MIREDFDAFGTELAKLSELYDKPISEALGLLYFDALSGYPIAEVVGAMRGHVRQPEHGRFFPKPADLIALLDGDSEGQALRAWTIVDEAWIAHGLYDSVRFEDPVIMQVLEDLGGWVAFDARCRLIAEVPFLRQEFCKRYRSARLRGFPENSLSHLPGLYERSNRANGFLDWIPAPIEIACSTAPRKALQGQPVGRALST